MLLFLEFFELFSMDFDCVKCDLFVGNVMFNVVGMFGLGELLSELKGEVSLVELWNCFFYGVCLLELIDVFVVSFDFEEG